MQEQFIFYPEHLPEDYKYELGDNDQEVFIDTSDDQKINGIHFKSAENKQQKVLLYFHGNAGALSSWQYIWDDLKGLGVDLLIIDYRGYGKSTGKITEQAIVCIRTSDEAAKLPCNLSGRAKTVHWCVVDGEYGQPFGCSF